MSDWLLPIALWGIAAYAMYRLFMDGPDVDHFDMKSWAVIVIVAFWPIIIPFAMLKDAFDWFSEVLDARPK